MIRGKARGSLTDRLLEIHRGVADVLAAFSPAVMALEQLYSHYQRPRTAILMGHARGVICLAAAEAGIPVVHYSATQVKKILTGAGRAGKAQVQRAIQRELGLAQLPEPADVADALAIALCHCYLKDRPRQLQTGRSRPVDYQDHRPVDRLGKRTSLRSASGPSSTKSSFPSSPAASCRARSARKSACTRSITSKATPCRAA